MFVLNLLKSENRNSASGFSSNAVGYGGNERTNYPASVGGGQNKGNGFQVYVHAAGKYSQKWMCHSDKNAKDRSYDQKQKYLTGQ